MARLLLLLVALLPLLLWGHPPLDEKIQAAIAKGEQPVVFVDLDATLFSESARVRLVLEAYDRTRGTQFFTGADWTNLATFHGLEDSVSDQLKRKGLNADRFIKARNDVMAFEFSRRFHPESIKHDEVYLPLKEAIGKWESAGAKIIFLTGRDQSTREATTARLNQEGLGKYPLITKDRKMNTALFKAETITEYRNANPRAKVVALLDDAVENLQIVHEAHPELLPLRTTQKNPTELELDAPLEAKQFVTIERYARNVAKWKYEFIPSRRKTHLEIVKAIEGNATPSTQPLLLLTSGGFGSGKTTTISQLVALKLLSTTNFNWIDPDKIRGKIPEYDAFKALDPINAGSLVHLEVGLIQEIAFENALKKSQSMIVEGTLRSFEWNRMEIERIRRMYPHYRIGILALKADDGTAAKRVHERAKLDNREIPAHYIAQVAQEVPETLMRLEPVVDFTIEVTNNRTPTVTRLREGTDQQIVSIELSEQSLRENEQVTLRIKGLLSPRLTPVNCIGPLSTAPPTTKE